MAGAEGIEPSAYGFGGLHGQACKRLITGHNSFMFLGLRCIKMFGGQFPIPMHMLERTHLVDESNINFLG